MAVYDDGAEYVPLSRKAGAFVNFAGAMMSLGVLAGLSVWGYQLVMRDVTGIPVVRAMEGAMRVAPENPGGEVAAHTGLAVNAVAAVGEAAPPEDRLVLAPATTDLADEDLAVQPLAEADEVLPQDATPTAPEAEVPVALNAEEAEQPPLDSDDILALVDQLSAGAAPMQPLDPGAAVAPTVLLDGQEVAAIQIISRDIPGVTSSLIPPSRPVSLVRATAPAAPAAAPAETAPAAVETASLIATPPPVGTKLVQLGAFPSPEVAATEWTRLAGQFADYMTGKDRLILEAQRNGKTFYRLRAAGFADLAEARRFCATLEAANAGCIPVVVR